MFFIYFKLELLGTLDTEVYVVFFSLFQFAKNVFRSSQLVFQCNALYIRFCTTVFFVSGCNASWELRSSCGSFHNMFVMVDRSEVLSPTQWAERAEQQVRERIQPLLDDARESLRNQPDTNAKTTVVNNTEVGAERG